MKNLLFICATLNPGGCERVFINLANLLVDEDYNVSFLLAHSGGSLENALNSKIHVQYTNTRMLLSSLVIRKYIKQHKEIDYVISGPTYTNIVVLQALQGLDVKVIITHHNYRQLDSRFPVLGLFTSFLINKYYPAANCIIAVSHGVKDYLLTYRNIKEVQVIYNPVSVRITDEQAKIQKEIIEKKNIGEYFLSVGRLSSEKNLPLMLHAFSEYLKLTNRKVKLVIVGDGPDFRKITNLVSVLNIESQIVLTGSIASPYYLLENCTAFLQTSLTEALPTVLIESLLFGKNIITTPTKGAKEVLHDGEFGFISKNFSVEAYCSELLKFEDIPMCSDKIKCGCSFFLESIVIEKYKRILQ